MATPIDPRQRALWRLHLLWLPGEEAALEEVLLGAGVYLYGADFGKRGPVGQNPGAPIQISVARVRRLLDDPVVRFAAAFDDGNLVGYAIVARPETDGGGRIAWVSQLVVNDVYRRDGVATRLLYGVWQFSDC